MLIAPVAAIFILLAVAVFFVAPFIILMKVAEARGRSSWFAVFAFWGFPGLVVGLLVLIALPDLGQRAG